MDANQTAKILIVDDIAANIDVLRQALQSEGYEISFAVSGEAALKLTARATPDLILLDVIMPAMDGFETCRRLKENESTQDIPVIFVTAKGEMESLVEGFRIGGVDYITKPFEKEEVLVRVLTHLKINRLTKALIEKNRALEEEIAKREKAEDALQTADERFSALSEQEAARWGIAGFVGKSKTIAKILGEVRQLQNADTTSVLITGESGTGKELIARAIHFGGTRASGPFVPINCSAIPSELAESILFGHVKGAFTGANTTRKGHFELADKGTLFLDEIGDMPIELQAKLLRVLEDGSITPIGGTEKRVNVRILAATNAEVHAKITEGRLREDLYYRLAGFTVKVPPLRERTEDIPLLVSHFMKMFAIEMGIERPAMTPEALEALQRYHFPGNIRELKHIIEGALILSGRTEIRKAHLRFMDLGERRTTPYPSEPRDVKHSEFISTAGTSPRTRPADRGSPKQLMLERAQSQDEERVLAYVHQHGSINNKKCRELLGVDNRRASYLLTKMERYGLLAHEGEKRWSRYVLKGENL